MLVEGADQELVLAVEVQLELAPVLVGLVEAPPLTRVQVIIPDLLIAVMVLYTS